MDENAIVDRIRTDADRFDGGDTDVDALVDRALLGGRRRRTRRRVACALTGAVVGGLAIAAISVGIPAQLHSGPRVVPAATPPQASASPARPSTPKPSFRQAPERVSASPTEVRKTFAGLLPDGTTVTRAVAWRDKKGDDYTGELDAALTVRDAQGVTYLTGAIGNGRFADTCPYDHCTTTALPDGGMLWTSVAPPGDKAGSEGDYVYNRPGGGYVWLDEMNFDSGNGPVTRPRLLLSRAEARTIVTSPAWDSLFTG